jgi:glycosyltransferase involved in cell wall biosynthesis
VDELVDGAGGAERFATGLAIALPPDRFEVTVCATRAASGTMPAELSAAGIEWFCLERRARFDPRPWARLVRFLRSQRPGVLHAHKFGSNVWGVLIGRLCSVPVVIAHEHSWSYEGQPVRRLLDRWLIGRLATRFVAVSELDRRNMVEIERVPERRTAYVPTAFIPRPADPVHRDPRAELGLRADATVVATVAGLRRVKRLDLLIDAFGALSRDFPDARLLLVGDGPARAELEERAEQLDGRVVFAGVRTDLEAVMGAVDIAAMTSDFEGMPLFAFEAMAYRTPLVATAVGGIPDVVEDGVTGLLVPRRDPAALEAALRRLLADPALRGAIADAAHERLNEFSMDAVAERFASLYEQLVAEAGRDS